MKNGDAFYSVSVWAHWNKRNPNDEDFNDYTNLGNSLTKKDVHNIVDIYKATNVMDGEGYDHFFHVATCVADNEVEGGFSIITSENYECWEV